MGWDWKSLITEDPKICAQCGGLCCQSHPGMYLDPIQFQEAWGLPLGPWDMEEVLSVNSLALKVCMGVPIPVPCYAERGCIFWSRNGCTLPRPQRPLGCLILQPKIETLIEGEIRCTFPPGFSYLTCFSLWERHYKAMGIWNRVRALARHFHPYRLLT